MKTKNNHKAIIEAYAKAPLLSDAKFIQILRACGDPIRHKILKMIIVNPGIIGKAICVDFKETQPTISFHINELKKVKLVTDIKRGLSHHYYANYNLLASFEKTLFQIHMETPNDPIGAYYRDSKTFGKYFVDRKKK